MARGRWGIFLCTCRGRLRVDAGALQRVLRLDEAPHVVPSLTPEVMQGLEGRPGFENYLRVLVGCCAPPEESGDALAASGIPLGRATFLDVRAACAGLRDGTHITATAARLIRGAMAAADAERPFLPPLRVKVAPGVLIVADGPAGLALAERLASDVRTTVILDGEVPPVPGGAQAARPFEVTRGRVTAVRGHLGDFAVSVEGIRPGEPVTLRAPQVVVLRGDGRLPEGGRHTGYHVAAPGAATELDALAQQVRELVGDFARPAYVQYNPATCAAGSAEFQGCGICIPACPYDALARDGRRIAVDELACEGCGACIAVCPTSALRFSEPPEGALHARLRGLLGPLPSAPPGEKPVVLFHCPVEGEGILRRAAEAGGTSPEPVLPVALPCLRFASEALLLETFRLGAAGVALLGCDHCAHGEREVLLGKVDLARTILEAFGLGRERMTLITGTQERFAEAMGALARFAEGLAPSPLRWPGDAAGPLDNRSLISGIVRALLDATGREPGRIPVGPGQPFARVEVHAAGCTLCGACAFVCPTQAITRDERRNVVEFTHARCVACGMCEPACPERVITLHRELFLDRAALEPQVLAQDAMIACRRCGKEYINRRALETIEARVLGMAGLGDTFADGRREILRMCPNCRAVAAIHELQKGWQP